MIYGYARVSTTNQNTDRQITNIQNYNPTVTLENETLFIEKISGKKSADERDEYRVLRRILRQGDELIVSELDRLGRTKKIVKEELEYFKSKGVILRILNIPTTLTDLKDAEQSWLFEMINNIIIEVYSSLAQQELEQKEARQRGGIEEAKKRGVYKGRKPIAVDMDKFGSIYIRWKDGEVKTNEFQKIMGLKVSTFYRTVKAYEEKQFAEVKLDS